MLALKKAKKAKEEEAKRLEAEAAADEKVGDDNAKESENGDKDNSNGGIKILGIGGKSIKKDKGTNKKVKSGLSYFDDKTCLFFLMYHYVNKSFL